MSTNRFACALLVGLAVAVGCAKKAEEAPATPNVLVAPPPAPAPTGPEAAPMPRPKRFLGLKSVPVAKDEVAQFVSHVPEPIRKAYRDEAACFDDLDGKAFAWEYAGGPVRLWVEFEEKAQATVPARYPEKDDWLAKGESGRIVFSVRRGVSEKMNAALRSANKPTGDTRAVGIGLTVRVPGDGLNASVAYNNPLWFGWADRAFDRDQSWAEVPFDDHAPSVLLVLDARERKAGNNVPRRAKLTLKAQRLKADERRDGP